MTEIDGPSLQREIQKLDLELGRELSSTHGKTKRLNVENYRFPIIGWIVAFIFVGAYIFAPQLEQFLPMQQYKNYLLIFALIMFLIAAFKTLVFLYFRLFARTKEIHELHDTPKAAEIRRKRDLLKAQLEEFKASHHK
ncbi:MAG: hypothetical protein ACFCU1_12375 [Sumerlaeia bacterium]